VFIVTISIDRVAMEPCKYLDMPKTECPEIVGDLFINACKSLKIEGVCVHIKVHHA